MQREGLIVFALLLTLAVLAPQGGNQSEAAAQSDLVMPMDISDSRDTSPAMSLTTPEEPGKDCELHDHIENASGKDVQLKFRVNVSI